MHPSQGAPSVFALPGIGGGLGVDTALAAGVWRVVGVTLGAAGRMAQGVVAHEGFWIPAFAGMTEGAYPALNLFSRREFRTTLTLDMAIAAAAIIGFRKPCSPSVNCRPVGTPSPNTGYSTPAAIGMSVML